MPERTLIVKPLGLVTQPNKLGQFPDGALSQAKDFITRAPGLFQQAYAKTAGWATTGQRPRLLHSTSSQLIALQRSSGGVWSVQWANASLASPTLSAGTLPYTSDDFSQVGRLQGLTVRGRTVINGATKDPVVADFENPGSAAERAFRFCGLPQPIISILAVNQAADSQAVLPDTIVSYAAVLRRKSADGYELISPPSVIQRLSNASVDPYNPDWRVAWSSVTGEALVAGDVVELYRSQSLPLTSPWTADVDPGATLYLVASKVLSSSDASSGFVVLADRALASAAGDPLAGLGEAMYTNPDFGGLDVRNGAPPLAACVSVFRGRVWYANCRFPAKLKLAIHNGSGILTTPQERTNGLGFLGGNGTVTNGSAVITSVSAADLVGLAVGMLFSPGAINWSVPAGTRIASLGASSITMTNPATILSGTGVGFQWRAEDEIEINGVLYFLLNVIRSGALGTAYDASTSRTAYTAYSGYREFIFAKRRYAAPATLTVRASRGDRYDPQLPSLSETPLTIQPTQKKNYVMYSHDQQPEAVPPTNELFVGTGEIYAQIPTRDAQWYFCSDGLHRLSGTIAPIQGVPDIRVDPIDSTLILAGPRAWCVLRDRIYAYTNRGLIAIADDSIIELTTGVIGDLLPGAMWNEAETPFLVADERTDEIYIIGAHATLNFVFSVRYGCFTTTSQFDGAQTGVQIATSLALVFGYTSSTLDELQPDLTPVLTTGPIIDFQPVFGNRPDTIKQFVDATYIFEPGSGGTLDPRFNGVSAFGESLIALGNDLRASAGVPCDAPAIGPSIAPGFAVLSAGLKELSGVSVRYVTFTEQQGAR